MLKSLSLTDLLASFSLFSLCLLESMWCFIQLSFRDTSSLQPPQKSFPPDTVRYSFGNWLYLSLGVTDFVGVDADEPVLVDTFLSLKWIIANCSFFDFFSFLLYRTADGALFKVLSDAVVLLVVFLSPNWLCGRRPWAGRRWYYSNCIIKFTVFFVTPCFTNLY